MSHQYKFETLQVHAGQEQPDPATGARAVPIYATTSFVFKDTAQAAARFGLAEAGNIYTRITNPTVDIFEKRIAALEGGVGALATSSGAAAISYAVQNIARAGDHIVSAKNIYGGTYNLFAHTLSDSGISVTFVDPADLPSVSRAIRPNTKLLFLETFGNPNSGVSDVDAVAAIAHRNGIPLIVDNTFATPYLFRPLEHGADIVVHSATKFIGGHGAALGGVVVDGGRFNWSNGKFPGLSAPNPSYHGAVFTQVAGNAAYIAKLRTTLLRDTGAALSPFEAFLFLQGLETLSLRIERHVSNALKVVDYLASHPKVASVNHPRIQGRADREIYNRYFPAGGGSIFTFEIKGGEREARQFIDKLKLFSLLANVADVKSLVIHPATTTHSQLSVDELSEQGIYPSTVRLSVGIENIDDILEDIGQALED